MLVHRAVVGQEVEFKTRVGDRMIGKVIRVAGDVYTVKLGTEDTRPVHHKFVTRLIKQETKAEQVIQ